MFSKSFLSGTLRWPYAFVNKKNMLSSLRCLDCAWVITFHIIHNVSPCYKTPFLASSENVFYFFYIYFFLLLLFTSQSQYNTFRLLIHASYLQLHCLKEKQVYLKVRFSSLRRDNVPLPTALTQTHLCVWEKVLK